MLGKFNFLCSFHIWASFLKIYGFSDYDKFPFFGMGAAAMLEHTVSIFCDFRQIILGVIKKWSSEAAFIWVIIISCWLSSLQFLSVTLPVIGI